MRKAVLLGALALAATACSNSGGNSAEESYRRGVAALEQGKPRTARVEFMNAIKERPDSAEIRVMQARTYLALGEGAAAESELRRAQELRVRPEEIRHLMAHALVLQNQPEQALEELDGQIAPAHQAYAMRMRGRAQMGLGDIAAAAASFDQALELEPKSAVLWTDIARFRRQNGELAGALQAADQAIALDPRNIDALVLRGELTRSQYGLQAAIPWFDRAVEIDPNHVGALLERAATLGEVGRMTAMLADTRKVLTLSNENPVAYYLQAVLAARAHKYDLARSLYRRTGGSFDNQPSGMLLASALDLEAGNVEQSIARLGRLVAMQPANRKARRLLAAAYWKKGDAAATINALRPIADRPDADSYSLSLMGQALAKQGKIEDASIYLARAAQPQSRSATALRPPVSDEELAAIRSTAALNPEDASAQVALVGALLSRGMGEDALALALRIRADNPGAPDAHILVGDARGLRGDFRGAAEEYRKAANLVFTETVAMRMIEALRRSGQGAAATEVLNLFLQQNPRNVPALLLAAGNMMAGGQWAAASRIYEGLRSRLGDNDAVMLNNLAWAYSQQGDYERAIPLARRAWELDSRNPATTDTLGWLLFKSGKDRALGLALLRRAARGAPTDAQIRQHLREAQQG